MKRSCSFVLIKREICCIYKLVAPILIICGIFLRYFRLSRFNKINGASIIENIRTMDDEASMRLLSLSSRFNPSSKIRRDREEGVTMEQKLKGWIFTEAETITTFQPGHWTWYPHCKMPNTFGHLTKEQREEVELHKIHQCSGRNFVQESRERLLKEKGKTSWLTPTLSTVKGTDKSGENLTKKGVVGDATQTPEAMDID